MIRRLPAGKLDPEVLPALVRRRSGHTLRDGVLVAVPRACD
jgi:hypothetical protein